MADLKIWIALRTDLGMSSGKMAAQAGHAIMNLTFNLVRKSMNEFTPNKPDDALHWANIINQYFNEGHSKIVVKAESLHALKRIKRECIKHDIPYAYITDEGRTELVGWHDTVCAFGPCLKEDLPKYLRELNLL